MHHHIPAPQTCMHHTGARRSRGPIGTALGAQEADEFGKACTQAPKKGKHCRFMMSPARRVTRRASQCDRVGSERSLSSSAVGLVCLHGSGGVFCAPPAPPRSRSPRRAAGTARQRAAPHRNWLDMTVSKGAASHPHQASRAAHRMHSRTTLFIIPNSTSRLHRFRVPRFAKS